MQLPTYYYFFQRNEIADDDSSSSTNHMTIIKRPRQKADEVPKKNSKQTDQPMQAHSTYLQKQHHDAFGEYIAEKLRSLPPPMIPFCQKIINDAIFGAEVQNLNITSRIVTDLLPPPAHNLDNNLTAFPDNDGIFTKLEY